MAALLCHVEVVEPVEITYPTVLAQRVNPGKATRFAASTRLCIGMLVSHKET